MEKRLLVLLTVLMVCGLGACFNNKSVDKPNLEQDSSLPEETNSDENNANDLLQIDCAKYIECIKNTGFDKGEKNLLDYEMLDLEKDFFKERVEKFKDSSLPKLTFLENKNYIDYYEIEYSTNSKEIMGVDDHFKPTVYSKSFFVNKGTFYGYDLTIYVDRDLNFAELDYLRERKNELKKVYAFTEDGNIDYFLNCSDFFAFDNEPYSNSNSSFYLVAGLYDLEEKKWDYTQEFAIYSFDKKGRVIGNSEYRIIDSIGTWEKCSFIENIYDDAEGLSEYKTYEWSNEKLKLELQIWSYEVEKQNIKKIFKYVRREESDRLEGSESKICYYNSNGQEIKCDYLKWTGDDLDESSWEIDYEIKYEYDSNGINILIEEFWRSSEDTGELLPECQYKYFYDENGDKAYYEYWLPYKEEWDPEGEWHWYLSNTHYYNQ